MLLITIYMHDYSEIFLGFKMLLTLQPGLLKRCMPTSDPKALLDKY